MMVPGMSAEASLYRSNLVYRNETVGTGYNPGTVSLAADTCQCTSPKCTWQCPIPAPPDPCQGRCQGLEGCAAFECSCVCHGGIWTWVGDNVGQPCGYVCT